jgi:hypothetical protein
LPILGLLLDLSSAELQALCAYENNYKMLREHMATRSPPCMPYLRMYQADLTFIEDSNSDSICSGGKLLCNFDKYRKIAERVEEVHM